MKQNLVQGIKCEQHYYAYEKIRLVKSYLFSLLSIFFPQSGSKCCFYSFLPHQSMEKASPQPEEKLCPFGTACLKLLALPIFSQRSSNERFHWNNAQIHHGNSGNYLLSVSIRDYYPINTYIFMCVCVCVFVCIKTLPMIYLDKVLKYLQKPSSSKL